MPLTCQFEELDAPTRDYLHEVRSRRGRGAPGVFVPLANQWPLAAVVFGPVAAVGAFTLSLGSLKDPWAVALLQTAAVLVGGWCVAYFLRRAFAGRGRRYGGTFIYFDPLHVYQVRGEAVTVTGLQSVQAVTGRGTGSGGRVVIDLGRDRVMNVRVPNAHQAETVEEYYDAMAALEREKDGRWADADPAVLGAAAKYTVEEGELPRGTGELDLEMEHVPENPARAGKAGFGWPALLAIVLLTGGVYVALWQANVPLTDDLAFARAKEGGAPGLRGYLLDDRNTRHRDEAWALLAKEYDTAVSKLRAALPPTHPEARDGMVKLVESLRKSDSPAVSIAVTEKPGGPVTGGPARAARLQREVADGLARGIDPKLIAFAAPAPDRPAHLAIEYEFVPKGRFGGYAVRVAVEVRTELTADPVSRAEWTEEWENAAGLLPEAIEGRGVDELKVRLCRELVGAYQPAPPMNFDGGDW